MRSRAIKQEVLQLAGSAREFARVEEDLRQYRAKDLINVLFSAICRTEDLLRWRAITCMGLAVARLAEENMEEARIVMRRLLWSLNDESGGIGWGAPECLAECMCRCQALAVEYAHMLLSYACEDGQAPFQEGNFIEHPLLRRGVLWGLARLSTCRPELLMEKGAATVLPPYLGAADPPTRGYAALAVKGLAAAGAPVPEATRPRLERMTEDKTRFTLYWEEGLRQVRVADLARSALASAEKMQG